MVSVSRLNEDYQSFSPQGLGVDGVHQEQGVTEFPEEISQVAHPVFNDQSEPLASPKPLIHRASSLEVGEGKITMGQGEYIVYHRFTSGEKKELSRETFEDVYKIFNYYAPAAIINRGSPSADEECANRYEMIKTTLKELDESLEVVFVPRTLYELIFIRECILEDLRYNDDTCSYLNPKIHKLRASLERRGLLLTPEEYPDFQNGDDSDLEDQQRVARRPDCWHLCYFEDIGHNDHAGVREVAYRLNQVAINTLSPNEDGFTYQELFQHTENEIEFLKEHHRRGCETEELDHIFNCSYPGPFSNFGCELSRGSITPMGIRDDRDAQIIRNAIAIDCSKVAQTAFILYRGSNFQEDAPYSDKGEVCSLSYGTSLFAGCVYDGDATAFRYMRKNDADAYATPIPFNQLNDSPFFIPPTNTVSQLFGKGEIFHGRTKAWKNFTKTVPYGAKRADYEHLASNLTEEELIEQFWFYKSRAIQLRG